MIKFIDKHYWL